MSAVGLVLHASHVQQTPAASEVMEILKDPASAVTASSDNFWAMAAGLQRFVEQEGNGSLPLEVHSARAQPASKTLALAAKVM